MRRTGNRRDYLMPHEFKVRCGGRLHTIALNAKGQLVPLDHDPAELRRERRYMEIGGTPCRCTQVIRLFRKAIRADESLIQTLPRPLQRPARLAVEHDCGAGDEPPFRSLLWGLRKPFWKRPEGLKRLVAKVLQERLGLPEAVTVGVTGSLGYTAYGLTLSSGASLLYRGRIPDDWKTAIYDHQLADLRGCLTVALRSPDCKVPLPKPQDQAVAVLCRPILGPSGPVQFVTRYGRLVRRPDGSGYRVARLWKPCCCNC